MKEDDLINSDDALKVFTESPLFKSIVNMKFKGGLSSEQRQLCNLQIMKRISEVITKFPGMRFGQILVNLDINVSIPNTKYENNNIVVDNYNEEPDKILARVEKAFAKMMP